MRFSTKLKYYFQNIGVFIIGILLIYIVNFDWFVKVIIIQIIVFAIIELLNFICFYKVDDSGIEVKNVFRKKYIKWNDVLGIIKYDTNTKDKQIIVINSKDHIRINSTVKEFTVLLNLINEKAEKLLICTDTNKLLKEIQMLHGRTLHHFCCSFVLMAISITIALLAQMITLNDLLTISNIIKLSVVFFISYMMAIRFLQKKI